MKTAKIAASLLSLAVIFPGLIVSNSVPAQAQNDPCPGGYAGYIIEKGDQLKNIAKYFTKDPSNWVKILNPRTDKPFSEKEASDLEVGQIVCLPDSWQRHRNPRRSPS